VSDPTRPLVSVTTGTIPTTPAIFLGKLLCGNGIPEIWRGISTILGKAISYGRGDIAFGGGLIQDFFNIKANCGPAEGDIMHNFVADYIYDLPSFSNLGNPLVRHLLGGWQASGIFGARSGLPLIVSQPSGIEGRPDYFGGNMVNSNYRETLQYLNKSAFEKVPLTAAGITARPGNLGKGVVRFPGLVNLDFSLGKNFSITEQIKFQFRADMFNALNHTNFAGVSSDINAAN
jgi:hypothetical protein